MFQHTSLSCYFKTVHYTYTIYFCPSSFFLFCDKVLNQKQLKERPGSFQLTVRGYRLSRWRSHNNKSSGELIKLHPYQEHRVINACLLELSLLSPFHRPEMNLQVQGMIPPTQLDFPIPVNIIMAIPHIHSQRTFAQVDCVYK